MNTPYTYHIRCRETDQHYYGVRIAKNCSPSDLWVSYFTSSKTIKRLISLYGKDSFDVRVRRVFATKEDALVWEQKVLRRLKVLKREDWINSSIGTTHRCAEPRTEEHKQKISKSHTGKKRTAEHCASMSGARKGISLSEETKLKMRAKKQNLIWISSDEKNISKLINREVLPKFIQEGWRIGRAYFANNTKLKGHTEESRLKMSEKKKGIKNSHVSDRRKGKVLAVSLDGKIVDVSRDEFFLDKDLVGVASKEGRKRRELL